MCEVEEILEVKCGECGKIMDVIVYGDCDNIPIYVCPACDIGETGE